MFKALKGMFGAMAPQGGNWADKLMMIGTGLSDIADGEGPVRTMALMDMRRREQASLLEQQQKAQKEERQQALMQQALGLFGGRADPNGASVQDMVSATISGDPNGPTVRDVVGQPTKPASLMEAAPVLAQLAAGGVDADPFLKILQATQPKQQDMQVLNLGNGGVAWVNPATGEMRMLREPVEFIQADPEKDLYQYGGGTSFDDVINPLMRREGGFVARDGNSNAPANFGINQAANPDIDVRNLTPGQAREIYKTRYWDAIGADNLPANAREAVFDAAVNQGPQTALNMWRESGENLDRFNALRMERYRQTPGFDQYGKSWTRRVDETGGAPRLLRGAAPKPQANQFSSRPLTAQEKAQWGLPADGVYAMSADGRPVSIQAPKSERPPTEGQINTASLTYAAFQGNERLNDLARRGLYKPISPTESLFKMEKGVPRVVLRNDQDRAFVQAAKEFLAPILRKDTGAAVTDQELATYMDIYIPRFEDGPGVMWQKAQARDAALRRLYGAGRRAYDSEYGAPGRWQVLTDPRGKPKAPETNTGWSITPVR